MKIANRSFLRAVVPGLNRYDIKDKKYTITAVTITTNKFGPSGSLKNQNIALEHMADVINKIINEAFFDVKYIFVIILEIFAARLGIEPRLEDSKSSVLPLDDLAMFFTLYLYHYRCHLSSLLFALKKMNSVSLLFLRFHNICYFGYFSSLYYPCLF